MNDRCNYTQYSRMTRRKSEWDSTISRTNTFWKAKNWDIHQGHWDAIQRNSVVFYTRTCKQFQVHILRIERSSSNLVPRAVFIHLLQLRRKERERNFIVDSGASFHMMSKSDFDSWRTKKKNQESKDPSVITANGTARTTEDATVYVWDLDMFVQVHCWKNHPRHSRWVNCENKTVTRRNGIQDSNHISSGRRSSANKTVPPMLWATASDHQLWGTTSEKCGNRNTRMVCFIYSWWDWRGDLQVRQTYLQWTWPDHLQQVLLLRILQQNLFETNQKERTLYSPFFAKDLKCEVFKMHESN